MVDITDQLHHYLIQKEIDNLKSHHGGDYKYIGQGKFERINDDNHTVQSARRVQSGSAFEPPQDNDSIVLDNIYGSQVVRPRVAVNVQADPPQPPNPQVGEQWYNQINEKHYVFNGEFWAVIQVGDSIIHPNGRVEVTQEILDQGGEVETYIDSSTIMDGAITSDHIAGVQDLTDLEVFNKPGDTEWENSNEGKIQSKLKNSRSKELKRKIDL